jgi:hypothetical protein
MGVGFQPPLAALLVLAQLPLPVVGPVDLLGGHRQSARYAGRLVAAAAQPAKHARGVTAGGLLVGGQGLLGVLAVGAGPGKLAAAVAGGLVEPAAQPVPLGPQLTGRHSSEIRAAGGVDRQGLAAGSREDVGQLQLRVGLRPVGQVQLPAALRFGPDHHVQPGLLPGPRQLHVQPVHILAAGEPHQRPPAGQPLGPVPGGGIGQIDPPVALVVAGVWPSAWSTMYW